MKSEKEKQYMKEYRLKNKEKLKEYDKTRVRDSDFKIQKREYDIQRRERIKKDIAHVQYWKWRAKAINERFAEHVDYSELKYLYENSDKTCYYCGHNIVDSFEFDHKISRYNGGKNEINNIVICCRNCNIKKGKRNYNELPDSLFE